MHDDHLAPVPEQRGAVDAPGHRPAARTARFGLHRSAILPARHAVAHAVGASAVKGPAVVAFMMLGIPNNRIVSSLISACRWGLTGSYGRGLGGVGTRSALGRAPGLSASARSATAICSDAQRQSAWSAADRS